MQKVQVYLEKINPSGAGEGILDSRKVLVWGGLPQERVKAIVRRKKGILEGEVIEVLKASPYRVAPRESHFLSCSPWQVMEYSRQVEFKKEILKQLFKPYNLNDFFPASELWAYRNKMEFSFTKSNGEISLAFFKRGTPFKKIPVLEGCALANSEMNEKALAVVDFLNKQNFDLNSLKSLVLRRSVLEHKILAGLFLTKKDLSFDAFKISCFFDGFFVYYSSPKTPSSTFEKELFSQGDFYLKEKLLDKYFYYPFDGFFQANPVGFEKVLMKIKKFVEGAERVVEFYSGVGVIGISVAGSVKKVIGIEANESCVEISKKNVEINNISNYINKQGIVEKMADEILEKGDLLILDPPRSGLHPKAVKKIFNQKPYRIIYVSCNPLTQARDVGVLKNFYEIKYLAGFDLYPQTPHLESLLVLDLKRK